MSREPVRYQPFLPGIMRGGAKQLGRALLRAQRGAIPLEVVDRLERLLGRHLPPEVALLFECPSCKLLARGRARGKPPPPARGASTAARVARLIPRVPVRHWVLSLPRWMRARLAEDEGIAGSIARAFVRAIVEWQQARARQLLSLSERAQGGAVTVVQRAGTALNLDIHVHALVLDGLYEIGDDGEAVFHPLPDPTAADLAVLSDRMRRAVGVAWRSRAIEPTASPRCRSRRWSIASPRGHASIGRFPASSRPASTVRLSSRASRTAVADCRSSPPLRSTATSDRGWPSWPATSRDHRSIRGRWSRRDGKVRYRLKRPFADGTTHVEFSSQELMEKLIAMVPSGPSQRLAFHGVLAPAAAQRCKIVPGQLELIPRSPPPRPLQDRVDPASKSRRRLTLDKVAPPRCPDCDVELRLIELEQATDWLVGG